MHFGHARPHVGGDFEAGTVHAQGRSDVFLEVFAQTHTCDSRDRQANPVDVDPILPALAGVEGKWDIERIALSRARARQFVQFEKARGVLTPDIRGKTCGVRHQVSQRDRHFGRPQHGLPLRIPPRDHLDRVDLGQDAPDGRIELEFALFDQLHGR